MSLSSNIVHWNFKKQEKAQIRRQFPRRRQRKIQQWFKNETIELYSQE